MACSEQFWVIPCSFTAPKQGRGQRLRGHFPQAMSLGLAMQRGWERGVYVLPFMCVVLSLCSPSIWVCCRGQTWCCTLPFAELFSLPAPHLGFVCGCTNIWHIGNSDRNGSGRARIAASTPKWQFWFQCKSDCHHREGKQSWELKYWPKIHCHHEEMYWLMKLTGGKIAAISDFKVWRNSYFT